MHNPLYEFIENNRALLESGSCMRVLFNDCYVTIFNEVDKETNMQKTVTLVEPCDLKINYNLAEIIEM